jgi:hypothetical protein|tara:strand:+ start:198 stop:422 length:225 start_codon:yes stop_codon:yes gene_type:complete
MREIYCYFGVMITSGLSRVLLGVGERARSCDLIAQPFRYAVGIASWYDFDPYLPFKIISSTSSGLNGKRVKKEY